MTVTIPLRLSSDIIAAVDSVRDDRGGIPSRNAIIREAIVKGLPHLMGKKT